MAQVIILTDSPEAFEELLLKAFAKMVTPGAPKVDGPDSLLTKTETCREFGISLTTLTEWQKNGTVPFIRLGVGYTLNAAWYWKQAASTHATSIGSKPKPTQVTGYNWAFSLGRYPNPLAKYSKEHAQAIA